jgi:hypothetical protein
MRVLAGFGRVTVRKASKARLYQQSRMEEEEGDIPWGRMQRSRRKADGPQGKQWSLGRG